MASAWGRGKRQEQAVWGMINAMQASTDRLAELVERYER